jgi:hypothetical protein
VQIGRSCAIAAALLASAVGDIGDFVMIGGRAGIADHVTIGDGAQLAGGSGVMHDMPAGARWGGTPAQPVKGWLREVAAHLRDVTPRQAQKVGTMTGQADARYSRHIMRILKLLPHRYPFLLIDASSTSTATIRRRHQECDHERAAFQGHFPISRSCRAC